MSLPEKQAPEAFNSGDSRWQGKFWVRLVMPGGRERLHVFWSRVLSLVFAFLLIAWVSLAGLVRGYASWRGITEARYVDLVAPWRWDRYFTALGHYHWEEGKLAHEEGRTRAVFPHLVACLRRIPSHVEARRLLSITYIRAGHLRFAAHCLEDGLPWGRDDIEHLKLLFGVLEEMQEDRQSLRIAQELLPAKPTERLVDLYVALRAALAHYYIGHFDQAEEIVNAWGLGRSAEGQIVLARCDWERGNADEALERLDNQLSRFPGRDELALERLRMQRELGRDAEWRRQALLRTFDLPDGPGPRMDWITSLRHSGSPRLAEERERFLRDFGGDARALVLLGWEAVESADLVLATRIRGVAERAGFPLNAFILIEVQAALAANRGQEALALAEAGQLHNTEHNPHFAFALAGLRALAYFAVGDPGRGDLELAAFVNHEGLRANDGVLLARELRRFRAEEAAERVLVSAVTFDPLNQAALTELVRLWADLGRWADASVPTQRLCAMRKPSLKALQEVAVRLAAAPPGTAPEIRKALAEVLNPVKEP